ncbi:Oxidoreductase FAD/NAD(P)-binding domain protein [Candidatus Zixiibacteriota bacterium]|nr:Oxidoreductase FAD/NAD(P)-binding domain protein [candidate division Zixibacteria bacterium]
MDTDLNAIVCQRIDLSDSAMIMRVIPEDGSAPDFRPGQFAVLGLPPDSPRCDNATTEQEIPDPDRLIQRSYSISSASMVKDFVEFYVSLVPHGLLTPRLFALQPGARLWFAPKPSGIFTLRNVPEDAHVLMFATSTGLAPFMSMLRTERLNHSKRKFALVHGARHSWQLPFRSELSSLQHICDNFAYLPIISRPDDEPVAWKGLTGHIQESWRDGSLDKIWDFHPVPDNTHIFLCGNPKMVDEMLEITLAEGYTKHTNRLPGTVHIERYW